SYTARATDDKGIATTSAAISIIVNTPPTVSITAPANNATFAPPASFTLTTNAADSDGTIAKVEFFDGAPLVGTVNAAPFNLALTRVAGGTHAYTAKATDNNNGVTTSAVVNVIVNAPPTITMTSPAPNSQWNRFSPIPLRVTVGDVDGTVTQVN